MQPTVINDWPPLPHLSLCASCSVTPFNWCPSWLTVCRTVWLRFICCYDSL
jgi:hypothetical protein